jgi:hypothetical protein
MRVTMRDRVAVRGDRGIGPATDPSSREATDDGPVHLRDARAMSTTSDGRLRADPGDRLVIRGHRLGEPERDGEILEALGSGGTPPFRVRWSDTGAETILFPGSDAYVDRLERKAAR